MTSVPSGVGSAASVSGSAHVMRDAEDCQIQIRVYGHDLRGVIDFSIEDIHVQTGTLFDHMGIGDHEATGIHEEAASQGEGMSGIVDHRR